MTLRWSPTSRVDRTAIYRYIADDSPRAAKAVIELIRNEARMLVTHPRASRVGKVAGTREHVLSRYPYVLVYKIGDGGDIYILRVLHAAQQWPPAD